MVSFAATHTGAHPHTPTHSLTHTHYVAIFTKAKMMETEGNPIERILKC